MLQCAMRGRVCSCAPRLTFLRTRAEAALRVAPFAMRRLIGGGPLCTEAPAMRELQPQPPNLFPSSPLVHTQVFCPSLTTASCRVGLAWPLGGLFAGAGCLLG
jgi:hypothetical protein